MVRLTIERSVVVTEYFTDRPIVFEHLSALLSAASQYSVLLIERAIVGLFRLCSILLGKVRSVLLTEIYTSNRHIQSSMRDQVYVAFDLVGRLPSVTAFSVAEQIMSGLAQIIQGREIIK
jgi:brefeldin A-resistance guanine nucleotide exchange factor 1